MGMGLRGFRGFFLMWLGQFVSLVGSAMTRFALTIWAYEITGSAMTLALVGFFSFGPSVIFSPIAGAMVDRWDRKRVMMFSDLMAGLGTVLLFVLYNANSLEIWHLYIVGFIAGAADSFQFPAFSAVVTMMLDKKDYVRANGLRSVAESASGIAAPMLGAVALTTIGLRGVFLIDIVTFIFAVGALLFIYIPKPKATLEGQAARGSLWHESLFGFRFIFKRPSLLGMQLVFMAVNLTGTIAFVLQAPMILARTMNNEVILGSVQTAMGVGGLIGGLVVSTWGGPQRRVHGVFLGMAGSGLLGQVVMGLGRGTLVWMIGAFMILFFIPLLNGANQAIWQAKVPPDLQGRVFAARRLIAQITAPVAMLLGGFLADSVFEPAMMPDGWLAGAFGWLVGTGAGAGMSLIFIITGLLSVGVGLSGYLFPVVRDIETILPDYIPEAEPEPVKQPETGMEVETAAVTT
jgi:MFS transporter, DHA3 family, macrolide efflux protein